MKHTHISRTPLIGIAFKTEEIPVQSMSPSRVPDEKWRYVDARGHGHFWEGEKLPTLEWVVTGTEWVGDEYESTEVEIGEHRCRLCQETIKPGMKLEYGPKTLPGPRWVEVTIDDQSFLLTEEEYAESVAVWAEWIRVRTGSQM